MDLDWNAFHPSLDKVFKIKIVITGGFTRTSQFDVVGSEKKLYWKFWKFPLSSSNDFFKVLFSLKLKQIFSKDWLFLNSVCNTLFLP